MPSHAHILILLLVPVLFPVADLPDGAVPAPDGPPGTFVGAAEPGRPSPDPEALRLDGVERDLLTRINRERRDARPARPALRRDGGIDRLILWHVAAMAERRVLSHTDAAGRDVAARVRSFTDDPALRCSEIIQWWSGPPNGRAHYDGYYRSPPHHDAYMERGAFNLGPTTWTGVAAVRGPGPAGSAYEGQEGSYTGLMFCDRPIELVADPFAN